MRALLGVLGGIPSIIYALMAVVFAQLFVIPKFTGAGIPGDQMPPPGMYWWTPGGLPYVTSTLLGGIMLSMLIIPFLAPLLDDAIRAVPHSLKEASLSLGVSRWQTLTMVTIPNAMSGIISACGLGSLKAMGDVVIVGMVVGFESSLPNPLFDILKSTAPLTSTGAGFSGLVLLVLAFGILALVAYLQRRYKKRFAQ
jgi:phosphate transport system permease protein